jgi:hypothetical protein
MLRESYRDGDKVKNRTLKNLSDWPAERIQLLRGETLVPAGEGLAIVRALPHGHVSAALGTARRIGLDRLLPRRPERRRKLALALIVARLIDPAAKLATARALDATTAIHSLGATLGLGVVTAKEVYAALDRLDRAQPAIEKARQAADRHRAVVRRRRPPDRGRGVRRRYRRSVHARRSDCQDQGPLRVEAGGAGRRPRPDHQRPHRRRTPAGRARLDHRAPGAGHPDARGRRRPAAAVAVRRARSGRDRKPGLSGRAPRAHPGPHSPHLPAARGRSRHRPGGRCRARPPQGRQALPHHRQQRRSCVCPR